MLPSREPVLCWMSLEIPAHIGVARLVPPSCCVITSSAGGSAQLGGSGHELSSVTKRPGFTLLATIATSGMSRTPSLGTPSPVCHVGLVVKTWLAPPPVALLVPAFAASVSFHAYSETKPTSLPFVSQLGTNSVPPTEVTFGSVESSLGFGASSSH